MKGLLLGFLLLLPGCSLTGFPHGVQNSKRIESSVKAEDGLLFYTNNQKAVLEEIDVTSVVIVYNKDVKEFYKDVRASLVFEISRASENSHLFITFFTESPKTVLHFVVNKPENLVTEVRLTPSEELNGYVVSARTMYPADAFVKNLQTEKPTALVVIVDRAEAFGSREAINTIFKRLSKNAVQLHPQEDLVKE